MLDNKVETNSIRGISRHKAKIVLGALAAVGLLGGSMAKAGNVTTDPTFGIPVIVLFSTQSDFTGWSANAPGTSATGVPASTYDYDGGTINGAGNNPGNSGSSINVGGTSPAGALGIGTNGSALGFSEIAFSPGEAYNPAFMQAIDPFSTAAFQPPNFVSGATTAASGTILETFTIPTSSAGNFFDIGINLAYQGDGFYQPFFGPEVNDGTVDGWTTLTAAIPYTITAGAGLTGFSMAIQTNSNLQATSPIYIDDIAVVVPEPASIGMLGAGLTMLTIRRRRKTTI